MLNWSLFSGVLPVALRIAAIGLAGLLLAQVVGARRSGRAKAVLLALCLLVAVATTATVVYLVRNVWKLFPDRLQPAIYMWASAAVFAMVIVIAGVLFAPSGRRRAGAGIISAAVVVAACVNEINMMFGAYPTLADALEMRRFDYIAISDVATRPRLLADVSPVAAHWLPPPGLPSRGKLSWAPIPALVSGFSARNAQLYLPPAYFADPRPQLPVLILVPGQPGRPQDWLAGGRLVQTMDAFANANRGLAPVVVVVDGTGSPFRNPLCTDSRLGNAATYLARDVPAWIRANLTVDTEPRAWAIGGASYGGTCALQMATNYPEVYPTFLDIAGGGEPTLGDRARTVAEAFGGDQAAFRRINPLELLRDHRYPASAGAIVIGVDDRETKSEVRRVYDVATSAGMNTTYLEVPGGHDWRAFSAAFARELAWLGHPMGLTQ
ncbi:hypothetical protein Mkiyose1088_18160 [Mycobacterium kiyosense]|uniref:Esterase n=1 Tax=Mycobacterium kiyosense TaxID=2871094 RepID=A0A9P3QA16_9MYCO|nr:hypothetical protein IWGMT90018_25830 [Mycobacterium kiyosense]BDE14577.1 hypothetical protein MKCMC460_34370 [Mycobacterium sp. 20KCMC460]GLB92582.1 hypothetical protein SRL2020130_53990 [Mycobacterium kiyosense]GLC10788.1 hypothetical protein SRL2020411_54340 [Mycobacterium kiyosense]GLC16729.1 hypothetical protein SRL2020448_53320 [Mycobacterium kiyosense]